MSLLQELIQYTLEFEQFKPILQKKILYVHICESFMSAEETDPRSANPQIQKNWSANNKSATCHICRRSVNLKILLVRKFAHLQFAERICVKLCTYRSIRQQNSDLKLSYIHSIKCAMCLCRDSRIPSSNCCSTQVCFYT